MTNRPAIPKAITELRQLIGRTPLLRIRFKFRGRDREVYAKCEHYSFTGSIKDRMALEILERAYESGKIRPGNTIVEATSGNTGIAFTALGRALGHQVKILMPDWLSRERVDLIRSLGGTVLPVTREQGGFIGSIKISEEMARNDDNIFLPCQFSNEVNVEAHFKTTGPEIYKKLQERGIPVAAFAAGVGTGGTVMGVGRYLKSQDPAIKVYPLEPAESPTISTGKKIGHHRIQGISDEFIPPIVCLKELDPVMGVSDGDAILMAQKLASSLGLAVGISSGCNFLGAVMAQEKTDRPGAFVTVFADNNKKYLSTDLLREEPKKAGYLSTEIELQEFEVV